MDGRTIDRQMSWHRDNRMHWYLIIQLFKGMYIFWCVFQLYSYNYDGLFLGESVGSLQQNCVYHNGRLLSLHDSVSCPDLEEAKKLLHKIDLLHSTVSHFPHSRKDVSMTSFLREEGVSEGAFAIIQALLVQEMSSKMDNCSIYEASRLSNKWTAGCDNYRCLNTVLPTY